LAWFDRRRRREYPAHVTDWTDERADELSELLEAWNNGDSAALDKVMPIVYDELRALAGRYLAGEQPGRTLQTTALVHEAYLRLVGVRHPDWKNRAYFFGAVGTIMRRILVDHARGRARDKRGAGLQLIPIETMGEPPEVAVVNRAIDVEALDNALERLQRLDARQARIVELRYFSGMTIDEIASVLGISPGTVKRDWIVARAWLFAELATPGSGAG
jgi:RNA polymerase sigma factor (TIGR02999 family)